MHLLEPIEVINKRLEDYYGRYSDGRPNWRVVFSDDEFEVRFGTFKKETESGLFLGEETGYRRVPKYTYIHHKYVLEKLMEVFGNTELTTPTSYEPVWTFEDKFKNPLPPKWEAIQILISLIHENMSKHPDGAKYKQPESESNSPEAIAARIAKVEEELFGNESALADDLHYKSGVSYAGLDAKKRNN